MTRKGSHIKLIKPLNERSNEMSNLLGSLGLDQVSGDPNAIPDNTYQCEVSKSELVVSPKKDTLAHVITYKVTEGEHKGANKQEWHTIGNAPRTADGSVATKAEDVVAYNPTMTDKQKTWYKSRLMTLGIPANEVGKRDIATLVGAKCAVNLKTENGWQNVKYVNAIGGTQQAQQTTLEEFATPASADVPSDPSTPVPAAAAQEPGF